ncbi:MAG: hypothetical protein ACXWC3_22575, partial [Burkholderiales bacterium]
MLTASLPPIRPPEFDTALTRYLDGDISGELALMHLVVALGDARALAPTLKSVASLKPPRRDLADL